MADFGRCPFEGFNLGFHLLGVVNHFLCNLICHLCCGACKGHRLEGVRNILNDLGGLFELLDLVFEFFNGFEWLGCQFDDLLGRPREEALYELTESVTSGKLEDGLLILEHLQNNGVHGLAILATLRNHITKLLIVRSF